MTGESNGDPRPTDTAEVRRVWNTNAAYWDARMGEGNEFPLRLLLPALDRLLALRSGERVLEIACGNGQLARWMAERGAHVVATDLSDQLIELAQRRTVEQRARIDFRVVDAGDDAALRDLSSAKFDAVVCNRARMDMPDIDPLARALPDLLGPRGRFVFSTTHPCLNRGDMSRVARWSDEGGAVRETIGMEIHHYLTPRTVEGLALIGQPLAQTYFERPRSLLLGTFLNAGWVVEALEEPAFPADPDTFRGGPSPPTAQPWYSWSKSLREIPPALLVRMGCRGSG
ncbi:MAG: class I SAM-dependent methyltransferase [Thermoplasmata archaeon]